MVHFMSYIYYHQKNPTKHSGGRGHKKIESLYKRTKIQACSRLRTWWKLCFQYSNKVKYFYFIEVKINSGTISQSPHPHIHTPPQERLLVLKDLGKQPHFQWVSVAPLSLTCSSWVIRSSSACHECVSSLSSLQIKEPANDGERQALKMPRLRVLENMQLFSASTRTLGTKRIEMNY
jgi:hypothetical protein